MLGEPIRALNPKPQTLNPKTGAYELRQPPWNWSHCAAAVGSPASPDASSASLKPCMPQRAHLEALLPDNNIYIYTCIYIIIHDFEYLSPGVRRCAGHVA